DDVVAGSEFVQKAAEGVGVVPNLVNAGGDPGAQGLGELGGHRAVGVWDAGESAVCRCCPSAVGLSTVSHRDLITGGDHGDAQFGMDRDFVNSRRDECGGGSGIE